MKLKSDVEEAHGLESPTNLETPNLWIPSLAVSESPHGLVGGEFAPAPTVSNTDILVGFCRSLLHGIHF